MNISTFFITDYRTRVADADTVDSALIRAKTMVALIEEYAQVTNMNDKQVLLHSVYRDYFRQALRDYTIRNSGSNIRTKND